jgi:hypothetical protein
MTMLQKIENSIIEIRGVPAILDADVAALYEVETMRINEAVKNNPNKFPKGYVLELSKEEKRKVIENFDNPKVKFSPALPKAFTEQGLYMLATILKSPQATQTTLAIIETFTKMRQLGRNMKALARVTSDAEKKHLMQQAGEIITDIFADDLEPLESETTIELNFALLKFKHTVKREQKKKTKK